MKTRLSSTRIPVSLALGGGDAPVVVTTFAAAAIRGPSASGALRSPNTTGTIKG